MQLAIPGVQSFGSCRNNSAVTAVHFPGICDKHWATAGITDTVDFLEGAPQPRHRATQYSLSKKASFGYHVP